MNKGNQIALSKQSPNADDLCGPPPLILYPTHGFANRLRFIASGVIWIRRMEEMARVRVQIPIWIVWRSTPECAINVSDFLHTKSGGVSGIWFLDADADAQKIRAALNRVTKQSVPYFTNNVTINTSFIEKRVGDSKTTHVNKIDKDKVRQWIALGQLPMTSDRSGPRGDVSYSFLTGGHVFWHGVLSGFNEAEELRSQFYLSRIVPYLKRWACRPNSIRPTFIDWSTKPSLRPPTLVGIHFRDFCCQFDQSDNYDFTKSSPLSAFSTVLKRIRHPKTTRFLIVSNSSSAIEDLKTLLVNECKVPRCNIRQPPEELIRSDGENVSISHISSKDRIQRGNRNSVQSMRQSVIDFFALAGCDIVVSTKGSSFSQESSIIGMRPQIHPVSQMTWKQQSNTEPWIARKPIRHLSRTCIISRASIPILCSAFIL